MNLNTVQQALKYYGLNYQGVLPVESGYRNSIYPVELVDKLDNNSYVNLLIYKAEPGIIQKIKTANTVSGYLAKCGLPVRQQIDDRIIKFSSSSINIYGCLYNYLPGTTIPWEAYTKSHIKLIGKTLGLLHQHCNDLPQNEAPNQNDIVVKQTKRMSTYFSQSGVQSAMANKLKLSLDISKLNNSTDEITKVKGGQQILHMDFVRGNILFAEHGNPENTQDNDKNNHIQNSPTDSRFIEKDVAITGILDFEKVSYGNRLHDIARTLAFLLVDCKYKPTKKIIKYFLKSGYIKRGGQAVENIKQLDLYLLFYLAYDFYKFLLHNPYEFLGQNEHYLRTRNLLLKAGVLETA